MMVALFWPGGPRRRVASVLNMIWWVVCGITTMSSWSLPNPPTDGRFARARRRPCTRWRRCGPSCRSGRGRTWRTAPGRPCRRAPTTRRRCSTSGWVKKRPSATLAKLRLGELLGGADDRQLPRPLAAVVHALGRLRHAGAEQTSTICDRRRQLLDRLGVVHRQVRPPQQVRELGAAREADDAELGDEDRVRAERVARCRAATRRSRG